MYVHADADICIRASISYKRNLPFAYEKKVYTGEQKKVWYARIYTKSFSLGMLPSYEKYDIVTDLNQAGIGDFYLPLYYGTITCNAYTLENLIYDETTAKALLQLQFEKFCQTLQQKGIQIVENDVKMFILCNPYNPIGKVWKEDELKQIGEICKKHDVLVIVDEIHEDFVYGDHVHIPFYNVDESYKEFSVVLTAPSKTFNLAGLQTSNIIIANEKLRKVYQETMNRYGVNEPNFLGIIACMTAYNECELWVDEMLEYVYDNFTYFDEFLKENLPHIHLVKPEGLYLGWVDFRECGLNKDELEKTMLEKAGLWLDEGYIFGTGGEGFERFNLAIPRSVLEDACQRLLKAFGK